MDGRDEIGQPMRITGLSRASEKDITRCYEAVKAAPLHRIHTFLATSDIHLKHKLKISRDECIEQAVKAVSLATSLCEDVEFSAEDACRSDPDFLCQVTEAVIKAGARTINIPDTVGFTTPEEYERLFKYIIENTPGACVQTCVPVCACVFGCVYMHVCVWVCGCTCV
jgi:2-isopropylmalate synthase